MEIGIRGNEKADSAAKSALELPRAKIFNIKLTNIFFPLCYDDWNGMVGKKLHCQARPERSDVLLQVVQER